MPEVVETARLRGTRLQPGDERELTHMEQDPLVYPTLSGMSYPPTDDDVHGGLDRELDHWRRHGFGLWLLHDRATGEMVGRGGLQYTDVTGPLAIEVAWAVVSQRWGEGLATELAHEAVRVAFGELRAPALVAVTLPHNVASRRVMEKAGFGYDREVEYAGLPHVLYRLAGPAARLATARRQPL